MQVRLYMKRQSTVQDNLPFRQRIRLTTMLVHIVSRQTRYDHGPKAWVMC